MARICGIDARTLDNLRCWDFFNYCVNIDAYLKHEAEKEKQMAQIQAQQGGFAV